jgi:hypothetical protein
MILSISEVIAAPYLAILAASLARTRKHVRTMMVSYGEGTPNRVDAATLRAIVKQFAFQQSIAFGVVALAVLLGLILSSAVIIRVVAASNLVWSDAARCGGIAADFWVGRYAFNLYRTATRDVQAFL